MDVGDLYRLARQLKALAEAGMGARPGQVEAVPLYQQLVLSVVLATPGVGIKEISEQASLAQSLVSKAVATLRDRGLLATAPDPADRRRVRVRPCARLARWGESRLRTDAATVLAPALADLTDDERACVLSGLALLHRCLFPDEAPSSAG